MRTSQSLRNFPLLWFRITDRRLIEQDAARAEAV